MERGIGNVNAKAVPLASCGTWTATAVPTANPIVLRGMAAVSANDIWAVGYQGKSGFPFKTLIEHWDGTSWQIVSSLNGTDGSNMLYSAARVPNSHIVWAVGWTGSPQQTLIERWNGSIWQIIPSPSVGTLGSSLSAVTAIAANNVWAVGKYYPSSNSNTRFYKTLIEHWDGTSWTIVSSPNVTKHNELTSIAAISANDIWAVGQYQLWNYHDLRTLTEHWDGTSWQVVPSGPSTSNNSIPGHLTSVAATATNDVWAVGYTDTYYVNSQTLIEHWNGTQWSLIPSPNSPSKYKDDVLTGVVALAANSVWAVGSVSGSGSYTLIEYWNGTKWDIINSPNTGTYNYLAAIVAIPSTRHVWSVGMYGSNNPAPYDGGSMLTEYHC